MTITYKKKDENFKSIRFVATACIPKNDTSRLVLQDIYVKDSIAYGADGFRIHYSKVSGLEDGLYSITELLKTRVTIEQETEELLYPDISVLINKPIGIKTILLDEDVTYIDQTLARLITWYNSHAIDSIRKYTVNFYRFQDAIAYMNVATFETKIINDSKGQKPSCLYIDDIKNNMYAVLMPMQYKANKV